MVIWKGVLDHRNIALNPSKIVLVESRCEASGLMWWAGLSGCVTFLSICHVCMITNGSSGNNPLIFIGN